jgi:L-lactate dehydrogenase complex protein LldG
MPGVPENVFLDQVRKALQDRGTPVELPSVASTRLVDDTGPLADLFAERVQQSGMHIRQVNTPEEARNRISRLIQSLDAKSVWLAAPTSPVHDLLEHEFKTLNIEMLGSANRDAGFQADLGVTGVDAAIAETGSLVLRTGPASPRLASLAPPIHVAIVCESQIMPDLLDWTHRRPPGPPPAGEVLITGPSKTGDIELTLVTGVHGPKAVHVLLLRNH